MPLLQLAFWANCIWAANQLGLLVDHRLQRGSSGGVTWLFRVLNDPVSRILPACNVPLPSKESWQARKGNLCFIPPRPPPPSIFVKDCIFVRRIFFLHPSTLGLVGVSPPAPTKDRISPLL
jgi:hypothetical protein